MQKVGPVEAGKFLRFKISKYELTPWPDPSTARRKGLQLTGDEQYLLDEAVAGFRKQGTVPGGGLDILIQDAFRNRNGRTFELIAEAAKLADGHYQNKFEKNLLTAMRAAADVMIEEQVFPTKDRIKSMVIDVLGDDAFQLDESQRWTEVLRESQLSFLPQERGVKEGNKHGEHSRTTREKVARNRVVDEIPLRPQRKPRS